MTPLLGRKRGPAKPTVLVVEDDENIAFYIRLMLKREGLNPVMAADGRQALEIMAKFRPPRLILMDIKLPFVDGAQLVAKVRAHPRWLDVPIILLTSMAEDRVINRALSAGANDYLVKPFQTLELMARVRHFIPYEEGEEPAPPS